MARKPCRWSTSRCPSADPFTAKKDEVILRPDREQKTNHIYHWEVGNKDATVRALESSAKRVSQRIWFQRCHPAPLEPCGCVAHFDAMGRLQFYVTSQAPHVYRTALALVTGIPEDKIHVISPDIGGGFGNKVPVHPGYVCGRRRAELGRPVKWIETRTENSRRRDSRATITWMSSSAPPATADDGASRVDRSRPRRVRCGRGSHEVSGRHVRRRDRQLRHPRGARGRTRTSPTRRRRHRLPVSFRVTEASYAIERAMDVLADELGLDAVELRRRNFIKREQFPYHRRSASPTTAATTTRRWTRRSR